MSLKYLKGYCSSPKNENYIIDSKPVRPLLIFGISLRLWTKLFRTKYMSAASYVISITKRGLTTEPEENTMLNKVTVFLLFLDQNVFSMLQNILTNPLVSHGLLWWCLYFLSGQGQYSVHTFSMEGQKTLRLNLKKS